MSVEPNGQDTDTVKSLCAPSRSHTPENTRSGIGLPRANVSVRPDPRERSRRWNRGVDTRVKLPHNADIAEGWSPAERGSSPMSEAAPDLGDYGYYSDAPGDEGMTGTLTFYI